MQMSKAPRPGRNVPGRIWQGSQTAHYYVPYILTPQTIFALNKFYPGFYQPGYYSADAETGDVTYNNPITPGQTSVIWKNAPSHPVHTSATGQSPRGTKQKQMRSTSQSYSRRKKYDHARKRKYY